MLIKTTNGSPSIYTIGALRRDNALVSFPKKPSETILAEYDVYPCKVKDVIPDTLTQTVADGEISQVNGEWQLQRVLVNLPLNVAGNNIREERDKYLQGSDWRITKSIESGEDVDQDWVEYRQALRDITNQAGFPYTIDWPTQPQKEA